MGVAWVDEKNHIEENEDFFSKKFRFSYGEVKKQSCFFFLKLVFVGCLLGVGFKFFFDFQENQKTLQRMQVIEKNLLNLVSQESVTKL